MPCSKEQGAFFFPRNRLLIACLDGLTDGAHFTTGLGLDAARFFDVLRAGLLSNNVFRANVPKLLARDFMPEAAINHVTKEIPYTGARPANARRRFDCRRASRHVYIIYNGIPLGKPPRVSSRSASALRSPALVRPTRIIKKINRNDRKEYRVDRPALGSHPRSPGNIARGYQLT